MRSTKKLLSLLVIALLCVGLVVTAAFAADGDELPPVPVTPNVVASGTCGENLTWVYDSAGNLVISGTGALEFDGDSPWSDFTDDVKTITIGEGVTSLCSYAFTNFHAIKTLALPDTMQTIGDGIIASCNSLMTFEVSANNPYLSVDEQGVLFNKDKTVLLCMPGGIQGDYQVPAGVTRIEAYAFYSCCYIDSITLPGSVTEIGRSAFQSSNMKNLTLSEGLLSIESYAIANCTCLTEIALPSSLEEIGEWAFSGSAIYSVQIPADTTSIGIGAFGNCLNLTDILVDSENISFSNDYHGALFNKDMTTLIAFPGGINGHYPVPDTVTLIGKYAFAYGRIDGVYLQEGVTKIDEYAFDRCSKMTFIELPESLEYIGYQAFGYCGLTEIVIPKNVTDLRSYAFIACTDLARITFKGSVPFIDSDTFQDVTADVYFPIGNTSWSQDVLTDYGGDLTWIPDQAPIRLEISDKPLVCLKDSTPDLSNVSVLAVYEGDVKITIPSRLLELGTCDVSTVGLKTLTVSYSGCSADIKVAVHDGTSAEPDVYPESSHPYNDYCDEEQIITIPGAQYISLTFSQDTYTEQGWDYIYLYDGYGEPIGTYSGDEAAGLTVTVPGDTVKIAFYSDGSNTYYGYSFSSIVGVDIIHPGDPAEDKAPTCSDPGYSGGIFCQICQDRVNHTVIPALGHEYEAVITPPTPEANGYTTHTCIRCGDNYTDSITIYGQIASGACGDNGWWALSDSGVLTIFGTGPMGDYDGDGKSSDDEIAPWHNYLTDIHHVVIEDGITNISSHAFDGCTNLSSIEIPDSVTSIARCAFWDCTNLKTIEIPDSVVSIGEYAFSGCTNLISVNIPNGVTEILDGVFRYCDSLSEIRIPASVQQIDIWALRYCGNLNAIWVDEANEYYSSDARGVLFNKNKSNLIMAPTMLSGTYTVPESVVIICGRSFYGCSDLAAINLPEGLEEIWPYAFAYCGDLDKIEIPDNTYLIGEGIFAGCTELAEVKLPKTGVRIDESTFENCVNLVSIEIPEGFTGIADNAFYGCINLETITLPITLKYVSTNAFYCCDNLTDVYYAGKPADWDNLEIYDGNGALTNATLHCSIISGTCGDNLTWELDDGILTISGTGDMSYLYGETTAWKEHLESITNVVIEPGVTNIGAYAFEGCTNLTHVIIPDSVTGIFEYAFYGCTGLVNIVLPESITSIGTSAFSDCTGLTSILIPKSVTSIGAYAFSCCTGLTSIVIPDSVTSIDVYAFYRCANLISIEIPDSVTSIGSSVFQSCVSLTSIVIPEGVTSIGSQAFFDCTSLTSIVIPESVVSINWGAFSGCTSLTDVYYQGERALWNYIWIGENNECLTNATIHFPSLATPEVTSLSNTSQGVKLTWNAVEGASLYEIYILRNGEWEAVGQSSDTSFTYLSSVSGEHYTFTVRCISNYLKPESEFNPDGWSITYVAQPSISKLENTSTGIKLTWKAVPGAAKYRIYVKSGNSGWKAVTAVSGTSYTFTNVTSGTSYTFTVRCVDADNKVATSSYSNTGWKKTFVAQPSISKLENTSTGIKLTWNAVSGAAGYKIYIKSGSTWKVLTTVTGTSYTYTAAKSGTAYRFTIRCVDANGNAVSAYNNTGWSQTYIAQPSISKLENTSTGIKLTWNAVSGAAGYKIYIKSGSTWKVLTTVTGTSYTYTAAKSGTAYRFTIRCVDANGNAISSYNNTGWKKTFAAQPSISKLENTASGIKLTWNAVNGAVGYKIYIKTSSGWKVLATVTGTSYTYTAAKSGTAYRFTIRCVDANGNAISSYNATGWRKTFIGQPTMTGVKKASSGMTVSWNAVSGATRYKVYVKTSSGWKALGTVTGTSFTYTAAKKGTNYRFTVRCVDANGNAVSAYNTTGWVFKCP